MKPIERRIEKLENASSWWREKHAAGVLTPDDMRLMTDQELLDFIGIIEPDPEAFVERVRLEQQTARYSNGGVH